MQNEQVNQISRMLEESRGDMEDKGLTCWLDEQLSAASIANVEQIVGMQPITEVPEYPAYRKGIINHWGNSDHTSPVPTMGDDDMKRYLEGVARMPGDNNKEKTVLLLSIQNVLFENEVTKMTGTQR